MSEQGWRGFLAAEGVDDWVVLHGGATAVFRVGSIADAARLATAVAAVDGFAGSGSLLTIVDASLTVRLTRDLWQLEPRHVDLARAVSAVAREHGAVADRSAVQEVSLAVASGSSLETWLDDVALFVEAPGLARALVAQRTGIRALPAGTTAVDLQTTGVDLKPYMLAPTAQVTAEATGTPPETDTVLRATATIRVDVSVSGLFD